MQFVHQFATVSENRNFTNKNGHKYNEIVSTQEIYYWEVILNLYRFLGLGPPSLTALCDCTSGCQIPVFTVHVVDSTTGYISQPDANILDDQGVLLIHLSKKKIIHYINYIHWQFLKHFQNKIKGIWNYHMI